MSALLLSSDLIFRTRIIATARALGVAVEVVGSLQELAGRLGQGGPGLVILDLEAAGCDLPAAIGACCRAAPRPRVVAFGSHVKKDQLSAARQAGADDVLARSAFVARLPELLRLGAP